MMHNDASRILGTLHPLLKKTPGSAPVDAVFNATPEICDHVFVSYFPCCNLWCNKIKKSVRQLFPFLDI
jgi:hypothetical protein